MEPSFIPSETRKLASIQEITKMEEIKDTTNLVIAHVLGWQVVVRKADYQVNQKIVYFEIDSILPKSPWAEFIKDKKRRIKTVEIREQLSQGIILPLSILDEYAPQKNWEVGSDVTEILKVSKYDDYPQEPTEQSKNQPKVAPKKATKVTTKGVSSKNKFQMDLEENVEKEEEEETKQEKEKSQEKIGFPTQFIEKSDEPRIQSAPNFLVRFKGKPYYATLKYDGSSATYFIDPKNLNEFYVCSRNERKQMAKDDWYYQMAIKYKIEEKLRREKGRYAIQSEVYGPKIGKNWLGVEELNMAVFTIKDLIENRYLDMEEVMEVCDKLDFPMVKIIEKGGAFGYSMDQLKKLVKGLYPNTEFAREGLVFRLQKDWHKDGRHSFKIINDDFLLAENKIKKN